jgi:hypothetical protein
MRRLLVVLSVLVLFTVAVSTATAQNQIILGGSTNDMTFTGTGGGNWTLSLPSAGGLKDTAVGEGTLSTPGCTPSTPCAFDITQPTGVTITGTETAPSSDVWNITQSGALDFSFGTGGSLLTGTLELVSLVETSKTGTINEALTANIVVTGGSLASAVGSDAVLSITVDFASKAKLSLGTLTSGQTVAAKISDGGIDPPPTPEPGSMVLVGSGLLTLGGFVRRRRKT